MHHRFAEISDSLSDYNLLVSAGLPGIFARRTRTRLQRGGSPVYGGRVAGRSLLLLNYSLEKSYKALLEDTLWENFGRE